MCVCVCACVCVRACVHVCVCVAKPVAVELRCHATALICCVVAICDLVQDVETIFHLSYVLTASGNLF